MKRSGAVREHHIGIGHEDQRDVDVAAQLSVQSAKILSVVTPPFRARRFAA